MRAVVLSLLAIVVAACSSEPSTKPTSGVISAPKDSVPGSAYAGVTDITGRVLLRTTVAQVPGRPDSVVVVPLAGATIRLSRNDKADGSGGYSYVTEGTTAADGSYQFRGVDGGYYLLLATAAQGLWTGTQVSYVPANTAVVSLDIQFTRD